MLSVTVTVHQFGVSLTRTDAVTRATVVVVAIVVAVVGGTVVVATVAGTGTTTGGAVTGSVAIVTGSVVTVDVEAVDVDAWVAGGATVARCGLAVRVVELCPPSETPPSRRKPHSAANARSPSETSAARVLRSRARLRTTTPAVMLRRSAGRPPS